MIAARHPSPSRILPITVAVTAMVVSLDLVTKVATRSVHINGLIHPARNPDLLLGIGAGGRSHLVAASALVMILAAGGLWILAHRSIVAPATVGLLVGGSLANLVDRQWTGAVHDWLLVGDFVVNLADLAVLGAAVAYWWGMTRHLRQRREDRCSRGTADVVPT